MAIYHCHTHAISRSGRAGSALACAAYRSGEKLQQIAPRGPLSAAELAAYRTGAAVADGAGQVHDYTRKAGIAHTEIVLPDGVRAPWACDRMALWNQAEAAETRVNSRVAREWRVALPHELTAAERIELARDFAQVIVARYGVAADVAVHAPSRSGDQRNWHAHILCTTRQIGNEGFGAKALIEWSNTNLKAAHQPYASLQIRELRMAWADCANARLAAGGHEAGIDHRSYAEQGIALEAGRSVHVGQVHAEARDRVTGSERILPVERLDAVRSAWNAAVIEANPEAILDRVSAQASVFTRADVAQVLHRFVNADWQQIDRTLETVMASQTLVRLMRGGRSDQGREIEDVYATRAVATREAEMLERADRLAASAMRGLPEAAIARGIAAVERGGERGGGQERGQGDGPGGGPSGGPGDARPIRLSAEQIDAVCTIAGAGQLAILRGVAGTGKTTTLSALRAAAEVSGVRIVGAALAGKAARELEGGSGIESRTLASLERSWEAGFDRLGRGDMLVVDEAGMVGAVQMARVLARVEAAGARLVLVGDERQLQPIEAGAAFRTIKDRAQDREADADRAQDREAGAGRSAEADGAEAAAAVGRAAAAGGVDGARTGRVPGTGPGRAAETHGRPSPVVAELGEVRRQAEGWQREAAQAFGRGEAGVALDAYHARGEVRLQDSTALTHAAIVTAYFEHLDAARAAKGGAGQDESGQDRDAGREGRGVGSGLDGRSGAGTGAGAGAGGVPGPDHIVTAYRNVDVEALNAAIRAARGTRGELGAEAPFRTDQGVRAFAAGDAVLLTRNDRGLGVANGDRGAVTRAEPGRIAVRLRDGRTVELEAATYDGVRHGYAVTTHRSQGMTVDRVHVMAGQGMHASLAYVAMTRQREGATLYASRDHFRDYATLRESIARERQAPGIGDYLPERNALAALRARIEETEHARQQERDRQQERARQQEIAADRDRARQQGQPERDQLRERDRGAEVSRSAAFPGARQDPGKTSPSAGHPGAPEAVARDSLRDRVRAHAARVDEAAPSRLERLRSLFGRGRDGEAAQRTDRGRDDAGTPERARAGEAGRAAGGPAVDGRGIKGIAVDNSAPDDRAADGRADLR